MLSLLFVEWQKSVTLNVYVYSSVIPFPQKKWVYIFSYPCVAPLLMSDLIPPYPRWGGELAWRTAHFTKQISFLIPGKVPFLSEAQNAWRELIILAILFTPLAKTLPKMLWPGSSAGQRVICDLYNFNTVNPSDDVFCLLFTYWSLASIHWHSEWSYTSSM